MDPSRPSRLARHQESGSVAGNVPRPLGDRPPIIFSLPATKLPLCTLPAYPAIALLASAALEEPRAARRPLLFAAGVFLLLGIALAAVGLGAIPISGRDLAELPAHSLRLLAVPSALALIVAGVMALASAGARPQRACFSLFLGLAFLVAWTFANGAAAPFNSTRTVGLAVAREYRPGDTLVIFRTAAQGLPFYTGPVPRRFSSGCPGRPASKTPEKRRPCWRSRCFARCSPAPEGSWW